MKVKSLGDEIGCILYKSISLVHVENRSELLQRSETVLSVEGTEIPLDRNECNQKVSMEIKCIVNEVISLVDDMGMQKEDRSEHLQRYNPKLIDSDQTVDLLFKTDQILDDEIRCLINNITFSFEKNSRQSMLECKAKEVVDNLKTGLDVLENTIKMEVSDKGITESDILENIKKMNVSENTIVGDEILETVSKIDASVFSVTEEGCLEIFIKMDVSENPITEDAVSKSISKMDTTEYEVLASINKMDVLENDDVLESISRMNVSENGMRDEDFSEDNITEDDDSEDSDADDVTEVMPALMTNSNRRKVKHRRRISISLDPSNILKYPCARKAKVEAALLIKKHLVHNHRRKSVKAQTCKN